MLLLFVAGLLTDLSPRSYLPADTKPAVVALDIVRGSSRITAAGTVAESRGIPF